MRNRFILAADTQGEYQQKQSGDYKIDLPEQTFTTDEQGDHAHKFPPNWYNADADTKGWTGYITVIDRYGEDIKNAWTQSAGKHNHNVQVRINNEGNLEGDICPRWYTSIYHEIITI